MTYESIFVLKQRDNYNNKPSTMSSLLSIIKKIRIIFKYLFKLLLEFLKQVFKKFKGYSEKLILIVLGYGIQIFKAVWAQIEKWGDSIFDEQDSGLNRVESQYLIEVKSKEMSNGIEWFYEASDDALLNLKCKTQNTLKLYLMEMERKFFVSFNNARLLVLLKKKLHEVKKERYPHIEDHHVVFIPNAIEFKDQLISFIKAVKDYLYILFLSDINIDHGIVTPQNKPVDSYYHFIKEEQYNRRE